MAFMKKRKVYIFVTFALATIGGSQLYVAGKVDYLKRQGWTVRCCAGEPNKTGRSQIPSLDEYLENCSGWNFLFIPTYKFKRYEQEQFLTFMIQRLDLYNFKDCDIIIESHSVHLGSWAELLAARVEARHFFVTVEETYHALFYRENIDFFYFKWKRNEIICSEKSCRALFNGYKGVTAPLYEMPPTVQEQDAVQDVPDFPLDQIARLDWNICHIGRIEKAYVPFVISGVAELGRRHPDKTINFIFVGNIAERMNLINKVFNDVNNVRLTFCNDLVPIPRSLFTKVDVVCAISQSARFAANEGTLTIVGTVNPDDRTPGVLGYDTTEQVYGDGTYSYVEALENVLVKRLYDGREYGLPKLRPADEAYENFWTIVKNADPKKEYYVERLSQERIREWTAIFPFGIIARGAKIILFGATDIAKDYRDQINSQSNSQTEIGNDYVKQLKPRPYCQIVAIVDEPPEEFDDEIVGVERLKAKDYDAIVITTFPQQAQAAANLIAQTVPDMAGRIVYNFQVTRT